MTLPACEKCNNGFSFEENVVRAVLAIGSTHPDLVAEREPGGRLERALKRDNRLKSVIDQGYQPNGMYTLTEEIAACFDRVFRKTVQGLFFWLYARLVSPDKLKLLSVESHATTTVDDVINALRPSPVEDISDQPLSELTPHSWHARQPILIVKMVPISGGDPVNHLLRLKRETPVKWFPFQPGIFSFAFVKREGEEAACIIDLWQTMIVTVTAPWPDRRGPLRKSRKKP